MTRAPSRHRNPFVRMVLALSVTVLGIAAGTETYAADAAEPAPAQALTATPVGTVGQLVVKLQPGADIEPINRLLGSTTRSVLLASRGIYLLDVPVPTTGKGAAKQRADWKATAKKLTDTLDKQTSVVYAEANTEADLTDGERFHMWPSGGPTCIGTDPGRFTGQLAATQLQLSTVHRTSAGAGVVAVLDTGIDAQHPALAGRIAPGGYDYVDDDTAPDDTPGAVDGDGDGLVNEGYGHGTFVAGVVSLVAPEARLLPMRVLDSEGRGNVFTVAEALYDAVGRGADVVNLSFGTLERTDSKVLREAVKDVVHSGVVVVAAAGNDGSQAQHYPAAMEGITSVAALTSSGDALAAFSVRGKWVDVAAPGEGVVSTLPCGYGTWSGTSVAAPFVAGAAAVLIGSQHKKVASTRLIKALEDGCDRIKQLNVRTGSLDLVRSLQRV